VSAPETHLDRLVSGADRLTGELASVAPEGGSALERADTTAGALDSAGRRSASRSPKRRRPRLRRCPPSARRGRCSRTRPRSRATSGPASGCCRARRRSSIARSTRACPFCAARSPSHPARGHAQGGRRAQRGPVDRGHASCACCGFLRSAKPTLEFLAPRPDPVQLPRPLDAERAEHDLRGRRFRHLVPHSSSSRTRSTRRSPRPSPRRPAREPLPARG
jgi:hypothetical protein